MRISLVVRTLRCYMLHACIRSRVRRRRPPRARRRVLRGRHVAGRVTLRPAPPADARLAHSRLRRLRAHLRRDRPRPLPPP